MSERQDFARESAILQDLAAFGQVFVNELAARFGISTVTIRKDLDFLERRSLLSRVRGGAVRVALKDEGDFSYRLRLYAEAKKAIARQVASLVRDGDVIAIDSSTTCFYLARELLNRRDLVVITYGLRTATLLLEQSTAMVVVPGGVLRRASASMVAQFGDFLAGRGRIDKGFFGAKSISLKLGLLELSSEEAEAKKYMIRSCDLVYALFTAAKITEFGLHSFAKPDALSGIYTDTAVPADFVGKWQQIGVPVTLVDPTAPVLSARPAGPVRIQHPEEQAI